jgi:predicted Rossmann-fold nucleotide-binding protein
VQTRKARPVPILLFGTDYWQRLINMDVLVEEGTISKDDLKLFRYVDTPEAAWQAICDFYQLDIRPKAEGSAANQPPDASGPDAHN